ncbi:hypothetical protein LARI1_G008837, partial [Lachnellula arida]
MHDHMLKHKRKAMVDEEKGGVSGTAGDFAPLREPEKELFIKLEKDYSDVEGDIKEQASIVYDFGDSRSERSSYKLPPKKEIDAGSENAGDPNLVRILIAAKAALRDVYRLCSDTSLDRKMTQQRTNILNEFYAGASGKADRFRHFKNAPTLVTYFTTMKQLLVYYYRVVHNEDGHFTRAKPDQIQAMGEIIEALALEDKEEAELALKHAIRRLYLALICYTISSVPFKSPVLSFCAMLSRKVPKDLTPIESWRLKDDLDLEDFGGSWLSHPGNSEFLEGAKLALFRRIQGNAELRAMFLTKAQDGSMVLCPKAMEIYEAHAQEFLKRALVLCHIPPGPPLREPELLDLLLSYVAYILPLRQLFLRQQTPGALISLYLWAKLDGTVWANRTLSAGLRKACTRAKRQFAASITKEKFSAKERANFDLEDSIGKDIEDKLDLIALAELSNHTYHTFNHIYASTTTLTINALLHRNYRASESWRTFFRFDHVLQGKRPRGALETLSLRMLDASKRGQMRRRGAYSAANLSKLAKPTWGQ